MDAEFLEMSARELFLEILDEVELKFLVALVMRAKNPKVAALLAVALKEDDLLDKPKISEPRLSFLYGVVYEGGEPGPAGVFAEVFSHQLNKKQADGLADIVNNANDTDAAGQIAYHLYDKLGDKKLERLLDLAAESDRWRKILLNKINGDLTCEQKSLLQ